jgi:hypothetical protein
VATESCMGGAWRRIVVEEKTAHEEAFFHCLSLWPTN